MKILTTVLMLIACSQAWAAPKAELWPFWQNSQQQSEKIVDHAVWDQFLSQYLVTQQQPYRLRYSAVSTQDREKLSDYLKQLQNTDPRQLNRAEQLAFWINLYNAATVDLILQHYPVKSITKIKSGFFSFGPWDKKILNIAGQKLSLNDIEHRILRPIFNDARLHYAVNCASIGCPNLAAQAYTAANTEQLLEKGAQEYVNHPRGVSFDGDKLKISSIYKWFAVDFGDSDAAILAHLHRYAAGELKFALSRADRISDYDYDWSLNDHP